MARAVFDQLSHLVANDVLAPLSAPGSPQQRLEQWARGVERLYSGGKQNCLLGAMVLSGQNQYFRRELAAAFSAWIEALAETLRESGQKPAEARRRATNALAQIQGALVISRGLNDTRHFKRILAELPQELLS